MANHNLTSARVAKKDEFYTMLNDVENELRHYHEHFAGKVVYCNCDDPEYSNFFRYLCDNFKDLGLKRLITTHYVQDGASYKFEIDADAPEGYRTDLEGDGDFRSSECIGILKSSDIVVTNPPFSLFREYIAQLMEHEKKFLVIGNMNAITYKGIFGFINTNLVWLGTKSNVTMEFRLSPEYEKYFRTDENGAKYGKVPSVAWFTNLSHPKRNVPLELTAAYSPEKYPKYDNYDAIDVSKVKDIPCDYDGVMGVPITFLGKHCPEQFEILDANDYRKNNTVPIKPHGLIKDEHGSVDGVNRYARLLIRRVDTIAKPCYNESNITTTEKAS